MKTIQVVNIMFAFNVIQLANVFCIFDLHVFDMDTLLPNTGDAFLSREGSRPTAVLFMML